ncbi:MAG: prefoldin subunit [Candidatus Aenigmatarchaeota archaeon]
MAEIDEKTMLEIERNQQQLQSIIIQKEALKNQIIEIEKALNELKNYGESYCYASYGNILLKKNKESMIKELEEELELSQIKIKSLETTENRIKERLKEIQEKIKD